MSPEPFLSSFCGVAGCIVLLGWVNVTSPVSGFNGVADGCIWVVDKTKGRLRVLGNTNQHLSPYSDI